MGPFATRQVILLPFPFSDLSANPQGVTASLPDHSRRP